MHLAIIMDGNRRFAARKNLETIMGHKAGVDTLNRVIEWCPKYGVDTLTVYALSTENLTNRSETELKNLFGIMTEAAKYYKSKLIKKNVMVKVLGTMENLPEKLAKSVANLVDSTSSGTGLLLQICLNYGGRGEIVRAVNKAIVAGETDFNEQKISKYLDSNLEPDLVVRPGGEQRISNFLIWQLAYSEIYFMDTFWPDIIEEDFARAVEFYQSRNRRFGS